MVMNYVEQLLDAVRDLPETRVLQASHPPCRCYQIVVKYIRR
jgi:hypothetical protein